MNIVQTNDYNIIAKLNKYVQDLHYDLFPEQFREYNFENVKNYFKDIIHNKEYTFLLLEDENEPIGYVWLEFDDNPGNVFMKPYKVIFVHQISVIDPKRNKGYGTKLMEAVIDIGKRKEYKKIELVYWSNNEFAKSFYDKKGFTIFNEVVKKYI